MLVKSILKSLVILSIWWTLSGAIYSRIAHLTINLQESEIYFCNFTNQLSQWFTVTIISQQHWYGRGKAISNLIVTNTSLSTQDEIWSQLFLLFLLDSSPKPKIRKLAKAPTTPPETPLKARRLPTPQIQQIPLQCIVRTLFCWLLSTYSCVAFVFYVGAVRFSLKEGANFEDN